MALLGLHYCPWAFWCGAWASMMWWLLLWARALGSVPSSCGTRAQQLWSMEAVLCSMLESFPDLGWNPCPLNWQVNFFFQLILFYLTRPQKIEATCTYPHLGESLVKAKFISRETRMASKFLTIGPEIPTSLFVGQIKIPLYKACHILFIPLCDISVFGLFYFLSYYE